MSGERDGESQKASLFKGSRVIDSESIEREVQQEGRMQTHRCVLEQQTRMKESEKEADHLNGSTACE